MIKQRKLRLKRTLRGGNRKDSTDLSGETGADTLLQILHAAGEMAGKKNLEVDYSYKGKWKYDPVDFIAFCRDWVREPLFEGPQESWARAFIGSPDGTNFWLTKLKTALLFWGKGSGKGSVAAKLLVYAGYLLKCMRDPRSYFRIGRTAPIHMINVSYNSFQAKTVFFQGYLIPTVLNTINPETGKNFFGEQGMDLRVNEGDILSNQIHFEKPTGPGEGGITAVSLAGDRGTAEGFSPLLIFVDEYSAMSNPQKAEKLVDDLEKSAQSRFGEFYKLVIASFKQGKNCLMSMKFQDAEEGKIPECYFDRSPTWSVNKMKRKEEFSKFYTTNPVKAARAYECAEVEGQDDNSIFKLLDRLQSAFKDESFNPVVGEVITCRSDQLDILEFKKWFKAKTSVKYKVHVDLAKGTHTDRAGIVMSHKEGMEALTQEDLDKFITGETQDIQFRVKADLILQIGASKERKQIILDEIRQFIVKLWDLGFKMSVTLDGYQSLDFIQLLQAKGIEAEMLSVDRNRQAYDSLVSIVNRNNIDLYDHPILYRELEELEESDDGKKIDHPLKSLKRAKYEDGIDSGCFAGETRIPLLDGTIPMIKDLDGREVWIYSCTPEGQVVPGKGRGRISKYVTELVDIILDNGATIRCTPDHRFMLRDGDYKEAQELTITDRIMPLRRSCRDNDYEKIRGKNTEAILTHHMVVKYFGKEIPEGSIVHHKDHNNKNNAPENLEVMCKRKHSRHHTTIRRSNDENYNQKVIQSLQEFNLSDKGRKIHSEAIKKTLASKDSRWFKMRATKNRYFRSDITIEKIHSVKQSKTANSASKELGCGRNVVLRVLKENNYDNWDNFKSNTKGLNHKIKFVEHIELENPIPVYDLEVDKWSNFALESGVFVHNSKDIADALAGSVVRAILAESPNIPLPPSMGESTHPAEELVTERDSFERTVTGGLIPVDSKGTPQGHDDWTPLLPTK